MMYLKSGRYKQERHHEGLRANYLVVRESQKEYYRFDCLAPLRFHVKGIDATRPMEVADAQT